MDCGDPELRVRYWHSFFFGIYPRELAVSKMSLRVASGILAGLLFSTSEMVAVENPVFFAMSFNVTDIKRPPNENDIC